MGRLGKPQRSNKHKKLKPVDPFYKGDRKKERNVDQVNQRPKNCDDQEIPKSFQELMKLRQNVKEQKFQRKKSSNRKAKTAASTTVQQETLPEKGMTRPLRPVPQFKQRTGESEWAFHKRVDRETYAVVNRAKLEDKFKVEIEEDEKGEVHIKKKEKKDKKKVRLKEKKERKAEKRHGKEGKKMKDFDSLEDQVAFGEVAMAPPSLTAKPRKTDGSKTNRPGTKSLLLKDLMQQKEAGKRTPGQGIKRKRLSQGQQRILDEERERVIALYRQLKQQKTQHS